MRRGHRLLFAAMLVVGFVAGGVVGCTSDGGGPAPTPTRTTSQREPFLQDRGIRPVRMTTGSALTYVLPTAGSQVLCQALAKDRWQELLGGRVGRWPFTPPTAGCQINDERGSVVMELRKSDDAFAGEATIAGRPARTEDDEVDKVSLTVALTDDALQPATHQYRTARHLLNVESSYHGDARTERALATRVLEAIVPVLAKETEPLPAIDDQGQFGYASTPLTGGAEFVDLPTPVQALQLCTLLQEEPTIRVVPTQVTLTDRGECRILTTDGQFTVGLSHSSGEPTAYHDRVAGRPAELIEVPGADSVVVWLRDDVFVDLSVSAPDATGLAERLVPLLAG